MSVLSTLSKIRGGWPGGWKQYARGYGKQNATPPFVRPTDPDDRRSIIPPLGLKEYWYPALPAKDIGTKKPVGLKMLGEDLVFFRDQQGEVQALWDYCPHRGAYLSSGDCFWKGFVSCPYHGATFDGNGECVEFITEGPDSKMVGRVKAKKYPTVTLKGVAFVWMGEEAPVEPKEDIPPEFFEGEETVVMSRFRYWDVNWMIALENTSDAHNCFYVHRNAIRVMFSNRGDVASRPRTPLGYKSKNVDGKSVRTIDNESTTSYYNDANGKLPYQMYYPRVGGVWPLHRYRLAWVWLFKLLHIGMGGDPRPAHIAEEWRSGMHLPSTQRVTFTRWCVPVEENLTRAAYFQVRRAKTALGRLRQRVYLRFFYDFVSVFNFSDQDYDALRSCRWQYPEYLSATDSHVVAERRLIAEHARGLEHSLEVDAVTTAEKLVIEAHQLLGAKTDEDYGQISTAQR